ncbi:hypothetical protein J31TS4_25060 [Paenibacillus sp. J31TS4]|uniref:phosphatase PAP2 family protein n=1 Tax=Paenibacillus sp. J31TS4 TaxID=2807195 RepID=UPI001B1BFC3F|nr:phosphatase PAP2 family protein [Paenibacillus sp. J31TS4]GIP39226.1 hypothetical protein J31TS4_25060 [Paenibacillus sp. J31TS4]
MITFQSMTQVTLWIAGMVFVLLFAALRVNPFRVGGTFVQELFTSRKYFLHFAAVLAILFFNKLEQWVERRMPPQPDFTSSIYKIEGDLVASIQHFFRNDLLTDLSSFFYLVVFPCLMVVSIGIYTYEKNFKLFHSVCYALMLNYMIAIPFYLFLPVNEVWYFHPNVDLLMHQVFPAFEQDYRPLSGLDNCFPSLHTSISVSMALLASRSNNGFWKWFTLFSAVFIIFSIFYLGVHWLMDMGAGLILGVFAARVGLRLSELHTLPGYLNEGSRLKG